MSILPKAAWTIVLSHMAKTSDVILEYLSHGRDDSRDSQSIIGCCATNISCRVQVRDEMTREQLLPSVGRQILDNMPQTHIGSTTIARKCTDWGVSGQTYH